MKASAVLIACLLFAAPAQSFQGGGFHNGFGHGHHSGHGGFGHGHHHGEGGFGLGFWGSDVFPQFPVADQPRPFELNGPADFPPPGVVAATIAAASALAAAQSYGPPRTASAPPPPPRGPHIIYVGAHPAIHGPQVIYGTN